jgi:hypothetical protein
MSASKEKKRMENPCALTPSNSQIKLIYFPSPEKRKMAMEKAIEFCPTTCYAT